MWSSALRSPLRRMRNTGARLMEGVWSAGFATIGRVQPARFERWSASGGARVLVLAPHPDDETLGCAGVMVKHLRAGDEVRVVFVTDGSKSRAMGLTGDAMAIQRQGEAAKAMRALGVTDWEWLGLCEREWELAQGEARLRMVWSEFEPELVYAPSQVDFHPEHLRVAELVGRCIGATTRVRVYPIQVPLTPALANCVAEVGECEYEILAARDAYESQAVSVATALRMRRYAAARYGMKGLAEEFCGMAGATYTRLHSAGSITPLPNYYGLRFMPMTDPLAYRRGREARKMLAGAMRADE